MENAQIHKINTLLNNPWVKEEIKRETRKYHEIKENGIQYAKMYEMQKSSSQWEFYSDKCLHEKKKEDLK